MSVKETGGAAFPTLDYLWGQRDENGTVNYQPSSSDGMTLRDYFAGQVIGQCQITVAKDLDAPDPSVVEEAASRFARTAYAIADAMIAERDKAR